MSATILIERVGPMTTVQDAGRIGALIHGVAASGPMDQHGFSTAAQKLPRWGTSGIEFTTSGLGLRLLSGQLEIGCAGGVFDARHNGSPLPWPATCQLVADDYLEITPSSYGNFGYVRFDCELDLPSVMGSLATNTRAGLGGFKGRALEVGDRLQFGRLGKDNQPSNPSSAPKGGDPIHFTWGIHAHLFNHDVRQGFVAGLFEVSEQMDRMGIKLRDQQNVFSSNQNLELVSEPVVPGDVQILGDGTPIVLMRDHQPTGGYPRIATISTPDLNRFAQCRPGTRICFEPITVEHSLAVEFSRRQM
ncbi:biotin-dependent carboxyltransferase family protein [Devosia algicola]|uniref:Biotin-dependent carboxyltransferase family protein n=1 Tax=Devosia algicola TaxID=3026418 RepID=A0ABY7YQX3_9HYPH|nr:biotin-dependent carboxyltransferase family protein [Devosia algicola]WDR03285.1 biotin-dependent carboxyltransferase family protein [Devosia algicola]